MTLPEGEKALFAAPAVPSARRACRFIGLAAILWVVCRDGVPAWRGNSLQVDVVRADILSGKKDWTHAP